MIAPEQIAEIRRLFYAEHWKIGTIATSLGLHPDTVRAAVETDRFNRPRLVRASTLTHPFLGFIGQTPDQYPVLRAPGIIPMIPVPGSVAHRAQRPPVM